MAKREIDGVLKDWGERVDYGRVQGRQGKNIAGGRYSKPAPEKKPAGREKLEATVRKAPEVMVKISGGGKDMRSIKAHMDYISRNGAVELEDEQGRVHQGKEDVRAVRDDWRGGGIPYEDGTKREAFNIVLSMPPGTNRQAVKDAARLFAAELFGNHQYVFAAHDDEKHPHVHLAVKAVDLDGVRLNPRKADLQNWRETFAEKLRAQGIDANATPRKARGIVRKAEKQAVVHIEQRGKTPRVKASRRADAEREASGVAVKPNPAQDRISVTRKDVQRAYGTAARALAKGDAEDKQLAVEIVHFVQQMPPPITQHEAMVRQLREKKRDDARTIGPAKTKETQQDKDQGGPDQSR